MRESHICAIVPNTNICKVPMLVPHFNIHHESYLLEKQYQSHMKEWRHLVNSYSIESAVALLNVHILQDKGRETFPLKIKNT